MNDDKKNDDLSNGFIFGVIFAGVVFIVGMALNSVFTPKDFTDAAQRAIDTCPVEWEVYDLDWANGELDLICEVD